MSDSAAGVDALSGKRTSPLRRAVIAGTVGTAIEWYDFFIFGTMAALVFPHLFFPKSDQLAGTLNSYAIFFVGFLARPIGAWAFGTYGDRIGRKATLIATLLFMGLATFLIGLMPTYSTIGLWAAVILVFLRACQGIGVAGEWAGAVLIAMECGSKRRKGLLGSWPQCGCPIGLVLSNGITAATQSLVGPAAFQAWAWRVPFLLSLVLVALGFYVRLGIQETPVFQSIVRERRAEQTPIRAVVRRNWREIILIALLRLPEQVPFYLFTVFVFTFGASIKLGKPLLTWAVSAAALVSLITIPLFGQLSDAIGRKTIYVVGIAATAIWGFFYYGLYATAVPLAVFIVIALSLIPHDMQAGAQASLIAESFTGRLRYSGASLGFQLASILGGGPAPIIALGIWTGYFFIGPAKVFSPLPAHDPYSISLYILACCIIGFVAVLLLKDRSAYDHTVEYEDQQVQSAQAATSPVLA